jgi:hypothetical protein
VKDPKGLPVYRAETGCNQQKPCKKARQMTLTGG